MKHKKTICCLLLLICLGLSSCGSYSYLAAPALHGAAEGGVMGYLGASTLGKASSESEAAKIANNKGYSEYTWSPSTGIVYGYK